MSEYKVIVTNAYPLLIDVSKTYPRLSPAKVAKALGADPKSGIKRGKANSPVMRFALRDSLYRKYQPDAISKEAARTKLRNDLRRWMATNQNRSSKENQKMPLDQHQQEKLLKVAAAISTENFKPSIDQIAKYFMSLAIETFS